MRCALGCASYKDDYDAPFIQKHNMKHLRDAVLRLFVRTAESTALRTWESNLICLFMTRGGWLPGSKPVSGVRVELRLSGQERFNVSPASQFPGEGSMGRGAGQLLKEDS